MGEPVTEVLIIGNGPVGSVAALRLAQAGVAVTIVDRVTEIPEDLRASTIHPPTLEMLDQLGLAEQLIAQGLKAPIYQFRDRATHTIFALDMGELGDRTKFPFRLQCEQYKLVRAANEALSSLSNVTIMTGTELVSLKQDGKGVTAIVRDADGERIIEAQFLIAADGANSHVRQSIGIAFEGFTYPEAYLCYSTLLPLEERLQGLCHVNYISDPDEWLVLLRAPTAWRVLLAVEDAQNFDALLSDEKKNDVFRRLLGSDESVETLHRTIYRIHQRVAGRFVQGRIALAGDAAHVNSPIGGYGMNGGIHDAFNLTSKLLAILRNGSTVQLLEKYDRQRRTIAESFVQKQTIENTKAMKEGWNKAHVSEARTNMADIIQDPSKRFEILYKQAMFRSVDDEQTIL
jgi:3-(3-hydroxy-phenyl)propionate hydroxylase